MIMKESTVFDCNIITLPKNHAEQGNLSVVENGLNVPFDVKRVFYLYDIQGGDHRNGHANKELWQLIVASCGSFSVMLDDGYQRRTFLLNRANQGLIIKPGIWRKIADFSSGSICLVLASDRYKEEDYIRNYTEFIRYKNEDK
jgi:hypothetical protein